MSWQAAAWLLLGGSTVLMFAGLPVAFAFILINLIGAALFLGGEAGLAQLVRNSVSSITTFSLTPIPLFVLMGEVLFHTGLAIKVIDGIERMIKRLPGRLAVVAVVAGTVFSAISLDRQSRQRRCSAVDGAGHAGSRLSSHDGDRSDHGDRRGRYADPPSALAVLLGSLSGISISKLLIGGVMPGIILSILFVAWIVVRTKLDPKLAPEGSFRISRLGEVQASHFLRHSADLDLRTSGCNGRRLCNTNGVGRHWRLRDDRVGLSL